MTYVLGNGMSALVIAACLDYLGINFEILSEKKENVIPSIMYLKYDNEETKNLYFNIFNINNENEYCKKVKVGFLYNGKIYEKLTKKMKENYLKKQHRELTSTSMSDSLEEFNAIKLDKVFVDLNERYKNKIKLVNFNDIDFTNSIVYDTTGRDIQFDNQKQYLYLVENRTLDLTNFDYIYDCNINNIKRYSSSYIEYLECPYCKFIKIFNYYEEPKVYISQNLKDNSKWIYIGRYSTKTQTKQEDIIKYILGEYSHE